MGDAWQQLDENVRAAHLDQRETRVCATGCFQIRHGRGRLARCALRASRLPREAAGVEVRLVITREEGRERWWRTLGVQEMVTTQEQVAGLLSERLGIIELRFHLAAEDGSLVYRQVGVRLRLGWLSIPLPRRLSPVVRAREEPAGAAGCTRVTVEVFLPGIGLLIGYGGEMRWQRGE